MTFFEQMSFITITLLIYLMILSMLHSKNLYRLYEISMMDCSYFLVGMIVELMLMLCRDKLVLLTYRLTTESSKIKIG